MRVGYSIRCELGIELGAGIANWPTGHVLGIVRWPAAVALAPYLGLGAAAGEYWSYHPGADRFTQVYPIAWWALAEAGLDVRFQSGFALRAYVGVAPLLNSMAFQCDDPSESGDQLGTCSRGETDPYISILPYFGIGLGYAF